MEFEVVSGLIGTAVGAEGSAGCSVVAGPALMGPWVFAALVASLMRGRARVLRPPASRDEGCSDAVRPIARDDL